MKKIEVDLIVVISLLILCFIPFFNFGVVSEFFSDYFVCFYLFGSIFLFSNLVIKNKFCIQKDDFIMISLSVVICFFSYFYNHVSLGNILTMICSILYLYYFRKCESISKKKLLVICIIASLAFVYTSINAVDLFYSHNSNVNPNSIAQILFILLIIINQLMDILNKEKLLTTTISIIILLGIYNCQSRSVLIVSVIYLFVTFFVKKDVHNSKQKIKREKFIYWSAVLIGILVPIILVTMYKNSFNFTFSLFGKNLYSGREKIWIIVLEQYKNVKNVLLGIPTKNYYGLISTDNLHNVFLTILSNYGVIYFGLYFIYLYKDYEVITKNETNNIYIICGIVFILLVGSLENILFSTEFNFLFCLLFSINSNIKNKRKVNLNEPD